MKRLIFLLLFNIYFIGLLSLNLSQAQVGVKREIALTKEMTGFYKRPDISKESLIKVLDEGIEVKILEKKGVFSKVEIGGEIGWVLSSNILILERKMDEKKTAMEKEIKVNETALTKKVTGLYTEPDISEGSLIKVLDEGTSIKVLEKGEITSKVEVDGEIGWILSSKIFIPQRQVPKIPEKKITEEKEIKVELPKKEISKEVKEEVIPEGDLWQVKKEIKVDPPKKEISKEVKEEVIPEGDLWQVDMELKEKEIIITWKEREGAEWYNILIYRDPWGRHLLLCNTLTKEEKKEVRFPITRFLPEPRPIWVTLKAVDSKGVEISRFQTSSFITLPEEPLPGEPRVFVKTREVRPPEEEIRLAKKPPSLKVRFAQDLCLSKQLNDVDALSYYCIRNMFSLQRGGSNFDLNVEYGSFLEEKGTIRVNSGISQKLGERLSLDYRIHTSTQDLSKFRTPSHNFGIRYHIFKRRGSLNFNYTISGLNYKGLYSTFSIPIFKGDRLTLSYNYSESNGHKADYCTIRYHRAW